VVELRLDRSKLREQVAGLQGQVVRLERQAARLEEANATIKRKLDDKEDELGKERTAAVRRRLFGARPQPRSSSARPLDAGNSSV